MGEAAKKISTVVSTSTKGLTVIEKIKNTFTNELILGICTHIGSHRDIVVEHLKDILEKQYSYQVEVIKLSDFIKEYYKEPYTAKIGISEGYSILKYKIDGGDILRKRYNSNSLLAELAINKIRVDRELDARKLLEKDGIPLSPDYTINDYEMQPRRICYIIDSLKNKEELNVLRNVYRDIFYLFSVYTPSDERINYLMHKPQGLTKDEANDLIETDEYENIGDHGQNVRDTFVEADFFIRSSKFNETNIKNNLERYLDLIFDTEIITPFSHETAMYFAKSAAGNSACLSRQVGATITDKEGVVIAQGWNDVPKYGGNLYRANNPLSNNCSIKGYCSNITHKNEIIDEIIEKINELDFNEQHSSNLITTVDKNIKSTLISQIENIVRSSKFKSIIEYSRSIHAEMHAIIIGSQLTGNKMIDGDLYCTTYPCHNCARHIVLAGIKNIYFIEPYKKSLCITLHEDSITEDETELNKVRILMYDGVAPRSYLHFFSMIEDTRKSSNGIKKITDRRTAFPKKRISLQSLPTLESQAVHALSECGILK
jgi:deoxycytidylate deaminase